MKFYCGNHIVSHWDEVKDQEKADWWQAITSTINEYKQQLPITISTSGSTGTPKKITHSFRSVIRSAQKTIDYFGLDEDTHLLLCLPARYVAGKLMIIRALTLDAHLHITPPSSRPLRDLNHAIDFVAMTPMQLSATLQYEPDKLQYVSQVLLGGGPISTPLLNKIKKYSTVDFYHSYGMTETITHVALRKLNGANATPYFRALEGVRFSLSPQDTLTIHANHLDEPEIITTDLVDLLNPSQFIWLGRNDHVINSGGVKLFPEKLESVLRSVLPFEFILVGFPDDVLGERMVLLHEKGATSMSTQEILQNCRSLVSKIKTPKEVRVVDAWYRTKTDKIIRNYKLYDA